MNLSNIKIGDIVVLKSPNNMPHLPRMAIITELPKQTASFHVTNYKWIILEYGHNQEYLYSLPECTIEMILLYHYEKVE